MIKVDIRRTQRRGALGVGIKVKPFQVLTNRSDSDETVDKLIRLKKGSDLLGSSSPLTCLIGPTLFSG